jgi:hypothetical protein
MLCVHLQLYYNTGNCCTEDNKTSLTILSVFISSELLAVLQQLFSPGIAGYFAIPVDIFFVQSAIHIVNPATLKIIEISDYGSLLRNHIDTMYNVSYVIFRSS